MSRCNRYACGLSLLLAASVACADVAGSRDLEVLPRFPDSKIVSFKDTPSIERIYPQGAIRRISGNLRYEREVAGTGQLTRVTYELPATHSASEVFARARESLLTQNAQLLYWCVGRECGSSSLWANAVFTNATLTGSDEQQAYALLRLAAPQHDSLVALYSITRGNKRAYLHAELFKADAPLPALLPTPATLRRQLTSTGQLRLFNQVTPTQEWVELLARSLNLDSTLRVTLSGAQAEAWREALVEQRVRASRLELGEADAQGLQVNVLR